MVKINLIGILIFLFLLIIVAGCDLIQKDDAASGEEFKRGSSGLIMDFVPNFPGDRYIVTDINEKISIVVDVRNKGTFPDNTQNGGKFTEGKLYIGGFDDRIIDMSGLTDEEKKGLTDEGIRGKQIEEKSKALSEMFLPAASPINPLGSIDSVEFNGEIDNTRLRVDSYNPKILVTACYPYVTKASPTVCIDPSPFDNLEEKVCNIGSQTIPTQGAPVAVTKIEQEASTNKIQFKIHIKNIGDGDVLKSGESVVKDMDETYLKILDKCSPLGGGKAR